MRLSLLPALLACALALPAQAGRIEDGFRGFIDQLKQRGATITELRHGLGYVDVVTPVLERRVDELPLGRGQYAVIVAPGCRACTSAVGYLKAKGLNYEVLDVGSSQTAREAYALAQGHGYPLVLVGTQRVTGWSERLFKDAVRRDIQETIRQQQGQGA